MFVGREKEDETSTEYYGYLKIYVWIFSYIIYDDYIVLLRRLI